MEMGMRYVPVEVTYHPNYDAGSSNRNEKSRSRENVSDLAGPSGTFLS